MEMKVVKMELNKENIESTVIELMVRLFELDAEKVSFAERLYEALDIDSIDAVDLIVELKKISQKNINPDEFKSVRTVGDILEAAQSLISE